MSVYELVEEIKELANFVEYEKILENRCKAEKKFAEMLERNTMPYYSAYYSDYLGDDISEMRIVIIDENGNEHECPQEVSERYACRHIKPHYEKGTGIADFIVELIKEGIIPVEFKIIEKVREEINRESVLREENILAGNITIEHLKIVKQHLLEKLSQQ
ncbi:MAG: hypothetical protein DRH17_13730 [Deltaproteobacteria bacterium]|nr:MAG: hypothetical protein DRH17_13730 [Deltaproteobacteria bacterium]